MKKITLLPHNEVGYKELTEALKTDNITSLNRATGTGKSFILLKYLYENRDKRILYMAPTYQIIDQLKAEHMEELGIDISEFKQFDTLIYPNITKMNPSEIASNYDIIICDEYHRCGAKTWQRVIKDIFDIIKARKQDTKIIGTTATEIRYLDNNRNMNFELFDSKCCSRLSLADAILQGILPIPTYYSYDVSLYDGMKKLKSRVENFIEDPKVKKEALDKIKELELLISKSAQKEIIENIDSVKGKSLVFSSSIRGIREDKKIIKIYIPESMDYIVNSNYSTEKNRATVRDFITNKLDTPQVLYSVNILNEGLHVKDVKSIFFLRPTKSPILFFQQLGRLMSYSNRNKPVYVYDLVGNIRNHPAIYNMFKDIITRAKELLETDPENRERYERIINELKIIDCDILIYPQIDELKKELSINNIQKSNINYLITQVETLPKESIEFEYACSKLLTLARYYTLEDFKKIKSLDMPLTSNIMELSISEFEDLLGGYSCIREKLHIKNNYFEEYNKIALENGMLPSIFNPEYSSVCNKVYINAFGLLEKEIKVIKELSDENLTLFDRLSLGEEFEPSLYEEILPEILEALSRGYFINPYVTMYLSRLDLEQIPPLLRKIHENNKDYVREDDISINIKGKTKNDKYDSIITTRLFRDVYISTKVEIEEIGKEAFIEKLYNKLIRYYKNANLDLEYQTSSPKENEEIKKTKRELNELYVKKIIYLNDLNEMGYLNKIEEVMQERNIMSSRRFNKGYATEIAAIEKFIEEHGLMPTDKTSDKDEAYLYKVYKRNKSYYSAEEFKYLSSKIEGLSSRFESCLQEYIDFIYEHKRRPVDFLENNDKEKELVINMERILPFLNKEQLIRYKQALSSINKREEMKLRTKLLYEEQERKR